MFFIVSNRYFALKDFKLKFSRVRVYINEFLVFMKL